MMEKEDLRIISNFRKGKWITLGADLFGAVLLFYLYTVNSNSVFLWMSLLLLVVGAIFVYIMGRAEKNYLKIVGQDAVDEKKTA